MGITGGTCVHSLVYNAFIDLEIYSALWLIHRETSRDALLEIIVILLLPNQVEVTSLGHIFRSEASI